MTDPLDITEIDVNKLMRMQTQHVAFLLFDIRDVDEFNRGHIKGAVHIPPDLFLKELQKMIPKKDTPIIVYDADGIVCRPIIFEAEKLGFINIVNLEGGYKAFIAVSPTPGLG